MSQLAAFAPIQLPEVSKTLVARRRAIPARLVREIIDGKSFYYKGYRQVLSKNKTIEEIMSDSGLQFFLKFYIGQLLHAQLNRKKYRIGAGELGFRPAFKNLMGLDVVVFERSVLTPDKINHQFASVAPKLVVEIDVNVELPDPQSDLFQEFVLPKIRNLFSFGTEKVVWVFTKSRSVLVATPDVPWQFMDWNRDVELLDGATMNIAAYVEEEGFMLGE